MGKIQRYYIHSSHPKGFWGKRALKEMNGSKHAAMPEWAIAELTIHEAEPAILDVGCGGGANIARLLEKFPKSIVTGLDRSALAIEKAIDHNYRDVVDKRCSVVGGTAMQMPLAREVFDLVTAFETIYFWPKLNSCLGEIHRILKPGGTVMIANELDGTEPVCRDIEKAVGAMYIYTIEEIEQELADAGFKNIKSRHDDEYNFVCVTARKPD